MTAFTRPLNALKGCCTIVSAVAPYFNGCFLPPLHQTKAHASASGAHLEGYVHAKANQEVQHWYDVPFVGCKGAPQALNFQRQFTAMPAQAGVVLWYAVQAPHLPVQKTCSMFVGLCHLHRQV